MPTPVSDTIRSTVAPPLLSVTSTRPPAGVNFTAFESRFQITCWRRAGSPATIAAPRSEAHGDVDALGLRLLTHCLDDVARDRTQIDRLNLQLQLARDDLADVQEIRNQLRLKSGVLRDDLESALNGRRVVRALQQEVRPAENRVQRRTQLVRHQGDEFVLAPIRTFGVGTRGCQRFQQSLALTRSRLALGKRCVSSLSFGAASGDLRCAGHGAATVTHRRFRQRDIGRLPILPKRNGLEACVHYSFRQWHGIALRCR